MQALTPSVQSPVAWSVNNLGSTSPNKGVSLVFGAGRVVESIDDLRDMTVTGTPQAFVTGYYAQGDGGGGPYWRDDSDTTSADNGGTIIVATDGGRWKLYVTPGGAISIAQFGAVCDSNETGSTGSDRLAQVNAALAWLTVGGDLYVPGFCKISGALLVNYSGIRVFGNAGSSGFITTSTTANVFTCAAELRNVSFEDFSVWSTVTKSAGAVFYCPKAARYTFSGILAADRTIVAGVGTNRLFRGIYLPGCDNCTITKCQLSGYSDNIVTVYGDGAYQSELNITGATRISGGVWGIHCGGNFGGLYLGEVSIDACTRDVVIDQSLSATINREIFLGPEAVLDACRDTCLYIGADGAAYLNADATWFAAAGQFDTATGDQCGLFTHATNGALQLKVTGARFFNCTGDGAKLNGAASAQMIGNDYTSCVGNGLHLAGGASLGHVTAVGGKAASNGTGIRIASGTPSFDIEHVDCGTGNSTAVVNSAGFSATQAIRRCVGYVTENRGSAVITSGTSSVTFNHGLAAQPAGDAVSATPITSPGTTAVYTDATTHTSTQATVRCVGAAAANISVEWRATLNVRA